MPDARNIATLATSAIDREGHPRRLKNWTAGSCFSSVFLSQGSSYANALPIQTSTAHPIHELALPLRPIRRTNVCLRFLVERRRHETAPRGGTDG
jgi:hypothetical protein